MEEKPPQGLPERDSSTAPLFKVFPRFIVILIGLVSVVFLAVLVYLGIFQAFRFHDSTARFWLIIAFSVCFAIFFYLFFPQEIKIDKIAPLDRAIDLGVKIAGPVALFLIILSVLYRLVPAGSATSTRYFEAKYASGNRTVSGYAEQFNIVWKNAANPKFIRVMDEQALLQGIVVEFSGGSAEYEGTVKDNRHPSGYQVVFRRGTDFGQFDIPVDE